MREETTTRTLYKFAELSDDAKEKALEKLWDLNVDGEWWYEHVFEDAKRCGAILGIEVDKIYFSGFSSQGDGACFTGSYRYAKGAAKAIADETRDAELIGIARELVKVQRPAFYTASASCSHSGHYYHSGCMHVDESCERGTVSHDDMRDALRSFADWIYDQLQKEYEYQTKREQVIESIEANEYEFTEEGKLA